MDFRGDTPAEKSVRRPRFHPHFSIADVPGAERDYSPVLRIVDGHSNSGQR
jgi:hypothetical protein